MVEIKRTYALSTSFWPREGALNVKDIDGNFVISVPIGFMEGSGDKTWKFVEEVVRDCVTSAGSLRTEAGDFVDKSSIPLPGNYVFIRTDSPDQPALFRKGPQGNRRGRAPVPGGSQSTVSDSKRSTPQQNQFRSALLARDGSCLLTDEYFEDCTASHIVPFSRSDVYEALLGYPEQYLYYPWMGLLLDDKLHHRHDRFDWALYPRENDYVVHYFNHMSTDRRSLHGKIIPFERFRGPTHLRPSAKLLKWHHRQCVQAHFRGFSHQVGAPDAVQDSVTAL